MRIGLFTDTYTPDINGVVTSIVTLKEALEKLGHTVFVITNHKSILNVSYEDGILRLPGVEVKFLYGYVLSSPIHIQAAATVKDMELDVIHAHSEFGIGIFARAVSKNQNIPLVSTYHTTYEDYTHYVNLLGLKSIDSLSRKVVASVSRLYAKGSELIIAPSEKTKLMLLGYKIKKRIDVIPTGLDLDRFSVYDEALNNDLKVKHGVGDLPLFVYIGRLAKEKSIDIVIESFKVLIDRGVQAQLLIVGDGPSRSDLEQLAHSCGISNNVIFAGSATPQEVVRYYQISDAFISASLTETQGLTYIESLACGLSVFARPDKPLEGIIVEDDTGFYFTDYDTFADKAEAFINADASVRKKLKTNALAMASRFDAETFANRVLNSYQGAIDSYFGTYIIDAIEYFDDYVFVSVVSTRDEKQRSDKSVNMFVIDEFLLEEYDLKLGDEMSRNEINQLEDEQIIYEAYQKMVLRISKRAYTSFEIKSFLRSNYDLNEEALERVIQMLEKRNFINDAEYLREKTEYYRSLHYGNYRIEENLLKKGFDQDTILEYLSHEAIEESFERARHRAGKFLETLSEGSIKQKESKLQAHLQRQGFEPHIIETVVAEYIDEYTEESEYQDLLKVMPKVFEKHIKRNDFFDAKNRTIRTCLSKGYTYDMIVRAFEELGYQS